MGVAYPVLHGHEESGEALSLRQVRVEPLVQAEEDTLPDLIICSSRGRGGRERCKYVISSIIPGSVMPTTNILLRTSPTT